MFSYKRVAKGQFKPVWADGRPITLHKDDKSVVLNEIYFGNAQDIMFTINKRLKFIEANGVTLT